MSCKNELYCAGHGSILIKCIIQLLWHWSQYITNEISLILTNSHIITIDSYALTAFTDYMQCNRVHPQPIGMKSRDKGRFSDPHEETQYSLGAWGGNDHSLEYDKNDGRESSKRRKQYGSSHPVQSQITHHIVLGYRSKEGTIVSW